MSRGIPTFGAVTTGLPWASVAVCFLVEVYTPDAASGFPSAVEHLRSATRAMAGEGIGVRYRRALLVRGDDTCFHVLEAPSAATAMEASTRAGLDFERIVEVVDVVGSPDDETDALAGFGDGPTTGRQT